MLLVTPASSSSPPQGPEGGKKVKPTSAQSGDSGIDTDCPESTVPPVTTDDEGVKEGDSAVIAESLSDQDLLGLLKTGQTKTVPVQERTHRGTVGQLKWEDSTPEQAVAPSQLEENLYANSVKFKLEPLGSIASMKPPVSFCIRPFPQDKLSTLPLVSSNRQDFDCSDYSGFKDYDEHAKLIAEKEHARMRELLWDLIFSRNIKGGVERARVLFSYVCNLHSSGESIGDPTDTPNPDKMAGDAGAPTAGGGRRLQDQEMNPLMFKQLLRNGKITYAKIFQKLCMFSNVPCMLVDGIARGADYAPGEIGEPDHLKHQWNLVYITNQWFPVDCQWAARRFLGRLGSFSLQSCFENLYFLANPHYLIHSHFPKDNSHQLLPRPLSSDEFHMLPLAYPKFFQHKLLLKSHKKLVVPIVGEGKVELLCSQGNSLSFAASLVFMSAKGDPALPMNNHVMHERVGNLANFTLRIPRTGFFMLTLFVCEHTDEPLGLESAFHSVMEYCIAGKASQELLLPAYPPCQALQWGPNFAAKHFAHSFNPDKAYIRTSTGGANIEIESQPNVRYLARMTHSRLDHPTSLGEHVLCRHVGNIVVITATLPVEGEFGLDVYAAHQRETGGTSPDEFVHIAQFIIASDGPFLKQGKFPRLPPGLLGTQGTSAAQRVLEPAGNPDPYVTTRTGQVDLVMKSTATKDESLKIATRLRVAATGKDLNQQALLQTEGDKIVVRVHLLIPGMYLLHVFASARETDELPPVFTYLINAQQIRAPVHRFPLMFPRWAMARCYLLAPTHGQLSSYTLQTSTHFRLVIPGARKVMVLISGNHHPLNHKPNDLWEGTVPMLHYWKKEKKLTIGAQFPDTKPGAFISLLEYSL